MERKLLEQKLLSFGYKKDTVDKLLQGKICPTAKKMFILEEKHHIPVYAWKDIKSFINQSVSNDTTEKKLQK